MKLRELIKEAKKIKNAKDLEVYLYIEKTPKVMRLSKVSFAGRGAEGAVIVLVGNEDIDIDERS